MNNQYEIYRTSLQDKIDMYEVPHERHLKRKQLWQDKLNKTHSYSSRFFERLEVKRLLRRKFSDVSPIIDSYINGPSNVYKVFYIITFCYGKLKLILAESLSESSDSFIMHPETRMMLLEKTFLEPSLYIDFHLLYFQTTKDGYTFVYLFDHGVILMTEDNLPVLKLVGD